MSLLQPLLTLLAVSPGGRLAVVDVEGVDSMLGLAAQVTRAVAAEAQSQHLAFAGPEALKTALPGKRYDELKHCGGQPACVAQALEGTGFTRAVLGRLGRDEKNYLLRLWLIDVTTLSVVADVDRAILIAAHRLQKDLEEAIPRLLRGEAESKGTLVVDSNLPDAQVSVNGEFIGVPPVTVTLRPGKYEVHLERKKYLPVTRLLEVVAGATSRERIPLLLKPGELPDEAPGALVKSEGPSASQGGGFNVTAPTWVALGVTVVGAASGAAFAVAEGRQRETLAGAFDPSGAFSGSRADAAALRTDSILAGVSFGVAGAGLLATVALMIGDALSPSSPPPVAVAPWVGPAGPGLAVQGRF